MSQNKKFLVFAVGEPQEQMDSWPSIVVAISWRNRMYMKAKA